VDSIPSGGAWQYEPKWDGFRCLAFKDAAGVSLWSKAGKPLARYFPEVVAALARVRAKRFVLDGELVVPVGRGFSFDALLHHVGVTSAIPDETRAAWTRKLAKLEAPPGFTGRAPGGPSRWSKDGRSEAWKPVRPTIVVEVRYDHWSDGRFRHGTTLLRRRPDKAPRQSTFEQVKTA
jgi:ATP-dependent DNA ligase